MAGMKKKNNEVSTNYVVAIRNHKKRFTSCTWKHALELHKLACREIIKVDISMDLLSMFYFKFCSSKMSGVKMEIARHVTCSECSVIT
jgi:hypothetical protein